MITKAMWSGESLQESGSRGPKTSTAFELDLLVIRDLIHLVCIYILTGKPLRVTLLPKRARLRGDRRARLAAGGVCATHAAGLDAAADAPAHTLEHAPELLDTTAFYY